ncbi:LytR/AlgR family response regulator transcription factor [Streptomyces sp. TR06-5]|uniref:LytR/AlgR family response regulator transcription factor n=1 Tax=unclassified Streptomyces TaxID=2593676 RepID=UPI0039A3499F
MLHLLAVDDEPPALEELCYLLRRDPKVGRVEPAADGSAALLALDRALEAGTPVDGLFLDVSMPGLDGLGVARVLSRFAVPPPVVFVTAHEDFAVPAFELRAVDYLLKPLRPERLAEAVRRVAALRGGGDRTAAGPAVPGQAPSTAADDPVLAVELSGVTRFVRRSEVRHVEARGDYARLCLAASDHLVRVPLSTLEEEWADAGFIRIHRRHLVAVDHIEEVRFEGGRLTVRVGDALLPVSRRSTGRLRELLVRRRPVAAAADAGTEEAADG